MCLSLASDSSETVEIIILNLSTVTAPDLRMHHVLIILTLSMQGHTMLNNENTKTCSNALENPHQVCCEDSPTEGLYNLFSVR